MRENKWGNGKIYNVTLSLRNNSKEMKVRGSIPGFGIFGKTQRWIRKESRINT